MFAFLWLKPRILPNARSPTVDGTRSAGYASTDPSNDFVLCRYVAVRCRSRSQGSWRYSEPTMTVQERAPKMAVALQLRQVAVTPSTSATSRRCLSTSSRLSLRPKRSRVVPARTSGKLPATRAACTGPQHRPRLRRPVEQVRVCLDPRCPSWLRRAVQAMPKGF